MRQPNGMNGMGDVNDGRDWGGEGRGQSLPSPPSLRLCPGLTPPWR